MITAAQAWRTNPAVWSCSNADYHASTDEVSSSSLGVFIASRPLYYQQFVAKTLPRSEPTEAMQLGSAFHVALLEPESWSDLVAVRPPDINRRTNQGKAEWQHFLDGAAGKIVIDQEQMATIGRMLAGVNNNPFAADLLRASGESEVSIRFEIDGVAVKARLDRLLDAGLVVDLKTTSDPSPEEFARSAYRLAYQRSAWIYRMAAMEVGMEAPEFLHLAVGTSPPHEAICFELDEQALALGERQVRQTLAELRRCRETGDWTSPLSGKINTLSLPRYAFFN